MIKIKEILVFAMLFALLPTVSAVLSCDSGDVSSTCVISSSKSFSNSEVFTGVGNLIISAAISNSTPMTSLILNFTAITVNSSGNITGGNITLYATNVTLNGRISGNNLGYTSGTGICVGDSGWHSGGTGGGHGGIGGSVLYFGGCAYDSLLMPTEYGTAGTPDLGAGSIGRNGGGIVSILANNLVLNSNITVDGTSGTTDRQAGGAGGSIYLVADTLSGSGLLSSTGGSGYGAASGGAGGRIAIYYNTTSWTGLLNSNVSSKEDGAIGSILYNDVDSKIVYIKGGLATNVFNRNTTFFNTNSPSTWNFTGHNLTFDNINAKLNFNLYNLIIENYTILNGFNLSCATNYGYSVTSSTSKVPISNLYFNLTAVNFTLPAESVINLTGCGYINGAGPGVGSGASHSGGSGASHGGIGGNNIGNSAVAAKYGSLLFPVTLGSAGGSDILNCGVGYSGRGGAAIFMNISDTLINNGLIDSSGMIGIWGTYTQTCRNGGGSGGSIWVNANNILGTGTFRATGGSSTTYSQWSGSGGGGRIALYPVLNFNGIINVSPGLSYGGDSYAGKTGTSGGPTFNVTGGYDGGVYYFDGVGDYIEVNVSQPKVAYSFWYKNSTSSWIHVVNNNGTNYTDGVIGNPGQYPIYVSGNTVQIGKISSTIYFRGSIDNVKIFSRVLTGAEVLALYNSP